MRFIHLLAFSACGLALLASGTRAGTGTITIDASRKGPEINPKMYGIFLEEINHGVDGGLYAEMVRNRAFEDNNPPEGGHGNFTPDPSGLPSWTLVQTGAASGSMQADTRNPLNPNTPHSLCLEVQQASGGRIGVSNAGFWGIGLARGSKYNLSFYARCAPGFTGPITASLEDGTGRPCARPARITGVGPSWKQFKATFTATEGQPKARLVLTAGSKGTVWFDMVSLMPAKRWKDLPLRPDIAQMIADLSPKFVRFPGGCVVEGYTPENAYNWKDTIGPVEQRPTRFNAWDDRRTHGFGFYEYLRFIEAMKAQPLFVMFAGDTCYYRGIQHVPEDDLHWVVDNYTDAIEYANGSVTTKWGSLRSQAGHPKPFEQMMIGIGNENWFPEYIRNYKLIYKAIKEKSPDTLTIACINEKTMPVEMVDNHHYASPRWFINADNYARWNREDPKVYIGELATSTPETDGGYNILSGLTEAAYMMSLEKNADVVRMVSYAPLLANVDGHTGWHGCINFDSNRVFGTPSYYVQKVFSNNRPSYTVATKADYTVDQPETVKGQVSLECAGIDAAFRDVRVEKEGRVLFASDFSKGTEGWKTESDWQVQDGAMQVSDGGRATVGDPAWSNCTVSARMKWNKVNDPNEGAFVLHFATSDKMDNAWRIQKGGKESYLYGCDNGYGTKPVDIQLGRWYDLKVEVNGLHIRCLLDGQLVQEADFGRVQRLVASAGVDSSTREVVLKVVNTHPETITTKLSLDGYGPIARKASVTVLKGETLEAKNTLDDPKHVVPVTSSFDGAGTSFEYPFAPNSLTVIRLKAGA